MSDKKISQLLVATSLTGTELVPIVQGGNTVQTTVSNIGKLPSSLTATQIAFGDGSNLMTSSADHVIDVSGGAGLAKIGINTPTPTANLHIVGNGEDQDILKIENITDGGLGGILATADAGGNTKFIGLGIAGTESFQLWTGGEYRFNGSANGMQVNFSDAPSTAYYDNTAHTGKFGINTSSPSVALDVVGNSLFNISNKILAIDVNIVDAEIGIYEGGLGGNLIAGKNTTDNTFIYANGFFRIDNTLNNCVYLGSKFGINTNSPSVALDVVGDAKIGIIAGAVDDTYLTIDNVIKEIKLNVNNGGFGAAAVKGIALDGVNDSYKFGNTQSVAFEIIGGLTSTLQTFFNGSNFGLIIDHAYGYFGIGDMEHDFNNSHINLFIDSSTSAVYFANNLNSDTQFFSGYESGSYSITQLGDTSGIYSGTQINISANISNNLIEFVSPSGNYIFDHVPTYATNTAALVGGLIAGNIYQLGGTLGSASVLAIVY